MQAAFVNWLMRLRTSILDRTKRSSIVKVCRVMTYYRCRVSTKCGTIQGVVFLANDFDNP